LGRTQAKAVCFGLSFAKLSLHLPHFIENTDLARS
jgi:hypothetical protein